MDLTTAAQTGWLLPAFVDNRRLRLFLGTMLYLAQGFPQGVVFYALASWLAVNGQPAEEVGLVYSAVLLPWSFKFLLGGVVDRFAYMPMGRRRGWLVGAQCLIVIAFLGFAFVGPEPDQIELVLIFAFGISLATAVQDIALDAMVIDLTPVEELGQINSFMFTGKIIGIAGGTAATGFLIEHYSITVAMLGALTLFAIPALAALLIRERPGEKLLPWTRGAASQAAVSQKLDGWVPILKEAFKFLRRRDVVFVLLLMMAYGTHQTIFDTTSALFAANSLEWGEAGMGNLIATSNVLSAVLCITIGRWLVDHVGAKSMAFGAGLLTAAFIGLLMVNQGLWRDGTAFTSWYLMTSQAITLFYLAMLVLAMQVTDSAAAATNFNILMGGFALGGSIAGFLTGTLDAWGGYFGLYGGAALLIAVSALLALGLSRETGGTFASTQEGAVASG